MPIGCRIKLRGVPGKQERVFQFIFFYHLATLTDPRVILNPEIRAKYANKTSSYEYTIQGKVGCDGIGEIIAVIDEDGTPTHVECLEVLWVKLIIE